MWKKTTAEKWLIWYLSISTVVCKAHLRSPHSQWDSPTWNPSSSLLSHSKDPSSENPSIHAFMGSCRQRGEATHFWMEALLSLKRPVKVNSVQIAADEPEVNLLLQWEIALWLIESMFYAELTVSQSGEDERWVCVLCLNTDCSPQKDNNKEMNVCPDCSDGLWMNVVPHARQHFLDKA